MIRIQGKFASYGELWFDEEPVEPLPDILVYRQRPTPPEGKRAHEFHSLATDLSLSESELWERMSKNTRYEIRRAQSTDRFECSLPQQPTTNEIERFANFFDSFAATRRLQPSVRSWLHEAARAGQLLLSHASQGGHDAVWHAYVMANSFVRLYQSATLRSAQTAALAGRGNRLLHWQDLLEFKRRGCRIYDWGGVFAAPCSGDEENVNRFKRSFGAAECLYYDGSRATNIRGGLYLPVRSFWSKLRPTEPGFTVGTAADVTEEHRQRDAIE